VPANAWLAPAPWPPWPCDADDDECPACGETYRDFRTPGGLSWQDGVDLVRVVNGDGGGYRSAGPVRWALRTLKLTAWRERHGGCVLRDAERI
jgi:hypothetical protein